MSNLSGKVITIKDDNRKYYGQQCQDDKINEDFRKLHKDVVNQIINFCKVHNIEIDEFRLTADGLKGSIPYGEWQACTDSALVFEKFTDDYIDAISMNKIVSNDEFKRIKLKQEPFLFSM